MFNRMSPLSPRKKNNTPKNAAGFGVLQTGGRGIKGTPEGGPWAGEFGGGRFQVLPPCMGGDTGQPITCRAVVWLTSYMQGWPMPLKKRDKPAPISQPDKSQRIPLAFNIWGHIWGHKSNVKI